jgi:hypothetical protein
MVAWRSGVAAGCITVLASVLAAGSARAQSSGHAGPAAKAPAAARRLVMYRCTDATGRVTIQNDVACPKGTQQQRQVIDVPPPVPAYVPREARMPALVAAERADEASDIAAAAKAAASPDAATDGAAATDAVAATDATPRATGAVPVSAREGADAAPMAPAPPPQLYACRTWDERELLTEDATPAERCAPLQVVAADGSTRSDAAACEKVTDQCEAVPADALCTAWQRRVDEAEFRWRFAGAKQDDDRRREYELLKAKLAQSDCAP